MILVIDAILIAVGYAGYRFYRRSYDRSALVSEQMRTLSKAIDLYYQDCRDFPTERQGVQALSEPPRTEPMCPDWAGPYFDDPETLNDPWGRPFIYSRDGDFYSLKTLGADGLPGGEGKDTDIALEDL